MELAKRWRTLILGAASFVAVAGCSADPVSGAEETDATGRASLEAITPSGEGVTAESGAQFCENIYYQSPCETALSGGCYNFGSALYRKVSSVAVEFGSITFYDDPTCQGNSITFRRHQSNLHEIGWGDRAASYRLN